jgi:hypothetical protein
MGWKCQLSPAVLITLLALLSECKKDKDPDPNSPAYKIEASEKLEIPTEIALL